MNSERTYLLTIACPDTTGIVAAVSGFLAEQNCNILDSAQFGDRDTGLFFMRVHLSAPATLNPTELANRFATVGERFRMQAQFHDSSVRPRVLIMVSKFGHCLNDLLYRYRVGGLKMDIPAIVSNHRDFYQLAASYDIPFHHLPVTAHNKAQQEHRLLDLITEERIDLVVLARYMQILSDDLCQALSGRAINIHHSFLPSFKGAKPYHQAYARGVKRIGATAHYVTATLDEGPIIEQEVAAVDHAMAVEDFITVGRDTECVVLARAVKAHIERRVFLSGQRTVVFR